MPRILRRFSDKPDMVALWVVAGLVVSTISVSILAAAFSVSGLSELFAGAATAVIAMASSLELAKFVLAAYLHQTWNLLNIVFKTYLLAAIVVLSMITSMGIFGFLSNAYESTSALLEGESIKVNSLRNDLARVNEDIGRVNKSIDEIPASRITKKMKARTEAEPVIAAYKERVNQLSKQITDAELHILDVKKKVGPLIYIARAFKVDIDSVVKWLILVFVTVFDPLAICLVLATSHALEIRRRAKHAVPVQSSPHPIAMPAPTMTSQTMNAPSPVPAATTPAAAMPVSSVTENTTSAVTFTPAETPADPGNDVIQMRFADDLAGEKKNAV